MHSVAIRKISYQNNVATAIIQRCWRGYLARKRIWSYGGERYNYCVLKVQCAWRIHMANKRMLQAWHRKVFRATHIMQSLYYKWHSKRLRWILHLSFLKKCVIKLQSAYRRRAARRLFELVKEAYRNRTAQRIQAIIRRFVGRCRALRRQRLVDIIVHRINEAAPLFSNSSASSPVGKTYSADDNDDKFSLSTERLHNSVYEQLQNQVIRILHKLLILNQFHQALVDTERALQLIDMQIMVNDQKEEEILNNFDISDPETWPKESNLSFFQSHTPLFMILRTILLFCKSCCWAKYGRTKQVNINTLEQTIGTAIAMMYEQRKYYAVWCQRRHFLAKERERLQRDYEAKIAAEEALSYQNNGSMNSSGNNSLEGSRRTSSFAMNRRRSSSKQLATFMSRKSSYQSLSAASSSRNLFGNSNHSNSTANLMTSDRISTVPVPILPIVPDYEDMIRVALHKRVWQQYSLYEILDVFHTVASWPRYSLLTQYDACFCKGNMLHVFLYLEHWQEIAAGATPQLFHDNILALNTHSPSSLPDKLRRAMEAASNGDENSHNGDDSASVISVESSVMSDHTLSKEDTHLSVLSRAPSLLTRLSAVKEETTTGLTPHSPVAATSKKHSLNQFQAKEYPALRKLIIPLFGYALQVAPDIADHAEGNLGHNTQRANNYESEEAQQAQNARLLKQQQQAQKYDHMRWLMQRAWRLTERAKHLISTGSPESYELYQRLEFMASANVAGRELFRVNKNFEIPLTVAKELLVPPNNNNNSNSTDGNIVSALKTSPLPGKGRKRRRKDNTSSSVQFQESISTSDSDTAAAANETSVAVTLTLTVQYTVCHVGPMVFIFGQIEQYQLQAPHFPLPTSTMAPSELDDICLRDSPYREIPFLLSQYGAVPLQPFILFSHELKLMATTHSLYVVKGALYKAPNTTALSAVNEEDEDATDHNEEENDEDKQKNEEQVSSLSKKPVLDQRRFQEYIHEQISLSYVPILSSASSTSSFNIPYRPLILNLDGSYVPAISSRIQPRIALSLPFVQEKRDRSINFNEVRYATLLLQRLYRGLAGRLRYKRIAVKNREIMRRWWLASKVLHRLKLMRHKHEIGAIKTQAMVKGWMWRRKLRRMNYAAMVCQNAFRIYAAKCKVYAERMRRDGGPQVTDMLRGGKLVHVNDRRFMLNIFRCGYNYRLEGFDMLKGTTYHGHIHQPELAQQLQQYNTEVIERFQGDRTSLASKQAQIQLWQHEKVVQYLLKHLQLVHRMYGVTNAMGGSLPDANNDLCIVVAYEPKPIIQPKLQAPRIPDGMNHPVIEYVKFKPSPLSNFKALRQQEHQRQQRLKQQQLRQQQQQQSKSTAQIPSK